MSCPWHECPRLWIESDRAQLWSLLRQCTVVVEFPRPEIWNKKQKTLLVWFPLTSPSLSSFMWRPGDETGRNIHQNTPDYTRSWRHSPSHFDQFAGSPSIWKDHWVAKVAPVWVAITTQGFFLRKFIDSARVGGWASSKTCTAVSFAVAWPRPRPDIQAIAHFLGLWSYHAEC